MCNESTSTCIETICIETTCIETTLYRNDREPNSKRAIKLNIPALNAETWISSEFSLRLSYEVQCSNDEKYNQTGITFKTCTNRNGVRATAVMLWSVAASLSWRSTVIAGKEKNLRSLGGKKKRHDDIWPQKPTFWNLFCIKVFSSAVLCI